MSNIFNQNVDTAFVAQANEGYVFKILSELLQNNIRTACFEIDENSIKLRMMDHHRRILIDLDLQAENFTYYKYTCSENKLYIGINLTHFHKMLKSVKKKDSIILFIEQNRRQDLGIQVIPKDKDRVSTSYIKIQNVQNLDISIPSGYNRPVLVSSAEYQKMCKEMANIGKVITVVSKGYQIKFSCDASNVYSREVIFGFNDNSNATECCFDFDTEKFTRTSKIAGLGSNIQIYTENGLPLLFKSSVGSLGKISLYMKSREQINMENTSELK